MTSVTQLGYLGLSVGNVDEWERFATQILGLQANGRETDGSLFLRMDEYHHRFIVHPTGKDDLAYIGWRWRPKKLCRRWRPSLPRQVWRSNRARQRRPRRGG
jgi:Dihydroxybiphenyl dioxygenase BphC D1